MWARFKQSQIVHGGEAVVEIAVNMDRVAAYYGTDSGGTRLHLVIGHDLSDHRAASWIDVLASKEEVDKLVGAVEAAPAA